MKLHERENISRGQSMDNNVYGHIYYKDEFPISHDAELGGMRFSCDLDEELQGIFLSYPISTDINNDASTEELLDTMVPPTYGVKPIRSSFACSIHGPLFARAFCKKIADRQAIGVLTQ